MFMEFHSAEEKKLVEKLLHWGIPRSVARGATIYREGDQPEGLYYLQKGLVGLVKVTPSGTESLLRVFKQGQFLGHRTLFADEAYHANAKCLENSELIFCPKKLVLEVFDTDPNAYSFLARALAKELRRAENRSVMISEGDVKQRVSSALLLFKKLYPDHLWTRTEIANYCASRTPTVIKTLGELEGLGYIKQEGRSIEILDEEGLMTLIHS
jgi:CRP-like cAMP-binding protein